MGSDDKKSSEIAHTPLKALMGSNTL